MMREVDRVSSLTPPTSDAMLVGAAAAAAAAAAAEGNELSEKAVIA